jgi:hypothetical protein
MYLAAGSTSHKTMNGPYFLRMNVSCLPARSLQCKSCRRNKVEQLICACGNCQGLYRIVHLERTDRGNHCASRENASWKSTKERGKVITNWSLILCSHAACRLHKFSQFGGHVSTLFRHFLGPRRLKRKNNQLNTVRNLHLTCNVL